MPFTVTEFFDVFRAYNRALWPAVLLAWVVAVILVLRLIRGHRAAPGLRLLSIAQWSWVGIVYHAGFFSGINPAAWLFAALFVTQALMLQWNHVADRPLDYEWRWQRRHLVGGALMAYALAYPLLASASHGSDWAAGPLFLVPCPLVMLDTGLMLTAAHPVPRPILVVPAIWSLIGGSAALFFGVLPDLMLFACAAILIGLGLRPTVRAGAAASAPIRP